MAVARSGTTFQRTSSICAIFGPALNWGAKLSLRGT